MELGNYIIPSVGKIFKHNNSLSFRLPSDSKGYEVLDINTENISIVSSYAFIDNKFAVKIESPLKGKLINKVFTNDDEIAIILNNNKDKLDCLQQWREWASKLTKLILKAYEGTK